MEKLLCVFFVCMLMVSACAETLPAALTMMEGEERTFDLPFDGYWESDALDVVQASGNIIKANLEGTAILTLVSEDEATFPVAVTVESDEIPTVIREAIRIGLQEWEDHLGQTFESGKKNKYTIWFNNTAFGWCGGFASYCLEMAGVPMQPTDQFRKATPQEGPYAIREAAVPKLHDGFNRMDRITKIPKPGYLVIYGKIDYYAYVHVGLITDVEEMEDGRYLISTVEGNVSSRIKRYCYIYDPAIKKERVNYFAVPEEDRVDEENIQYTPHQAKWYITEFCQTWQ